MPTAEYDPKKKYTMGALLKEALGPYEKDGLNVLETLTPVEQRIANLCLQGMPQTEIVKKLSSTRSKVSSALVRIIGKLHDPNRRKKLKKFLDE